MKKWFQLPVDGYRSIAILLISLLGFPMTYLTNAAQVSHAESGLLVSGVVCLSIICLLTYLVVNYRNKESTDWLFYVWTLGCFASVIDLIIALEFEGFIEGFMNVYLRSGEPYLSTPYGSSICLWDGTAHYIMYITMLMAIALKLDYRRIGLYWAGSIGHSMLVLIPGAILGKTGIKWSFLLNVPYIFIPFLAGARFLKENRNSAESDSKYQLTIKRRPIDVLMIVLLLLTTSISLFRGFVALGWKHELSIAYLSHYEPYILDPVAFPKVQMLIYLFYFVPLHIMIICGLLLSSNSTWLTNWVYILAGASAQAQFPHIAASLHNQTSEEFKVPVSFESRTVFWGVNSFLLIVPHLILFSRLSYPRKIDEGSKKKN